MGCKVYGGRTAIETPEAAGFIVDRCTHFIEPSEIHIEIDRSRYLSSIPARVVRIACDTLPASYDQLPRCDREKIDAGDYERIRCFLAAVLAAGDDITCTY